MSNLESNKRNAIAFYELMFNECKPREAIEQFVGDEYIQHNPDVETGKAGFIAYFERMAATVPSRPCPGTSSLNRLLFANIQQAKRISPQLP